MPVCVKTEHWLIIPAIIDRCLFCVSELFTFTLAVVVGLPLNNGGDDDDPESYPFAVAPNATLLLCFFQLNITFLPHTNCHCNLLHTQRYTHSLTDYVLMGT